MPLLDGLTHEIIAYNRKFQELTAQIYEDGIVTCQEATDGTAYYQSVRPRIKRLHKATRRWIRVIFHRYIVHVTINPYSDKRSALLEKGNAKLVAYQERLKEIEQLLNDSQVMLKIFADVLSDCGEGGS